MTNNEYLDKILEQQTFEKGSKELSELETQGDAVRRALEEHFAESSPVIEYGGSMAKGTMIKAAYDLDIICYFPRDDEDAGGTLKDIYRNTRDALANSYMVEEKPSALRLRGKAATVNTGLDFHIDVVPGRFIDGDSGDAFLYQNGGDKERLRTNLRTHIAHVQKSGVVDAIRLMKLWRFQHGLTIKHFALELLVIDLLAEKKEVGHAAQLEHVWTVFRDESDRLSVKDPANEDGNDLAQLLSDDVRTLLSTVASETLELIESSGWEAVYGAVQETANTPMERTAFPAAVTSVTKPSRPWASG